MQKYFSVLVLTSEWVEVLYKVPYSITLDHCKNAILSVLLLASSRWVEQSLV